MSYTNYSIGIDKRFPSCFYEMTVKDKVTPKSFFKLLGVTNAWIKLIK